MLVKRILIGVAAIIAAASIIFAIKPFSASSGYITGEDGARITFLTYPSGSSCGSPILDAWRGSDEVFAVQTGLLVPEDSSYVNATTCRSEAQHRLRVAALGLLICFALIALVILMGRGRGFGFRRRVQAPT